MKLAITILSLSLLTACSYKYESKSINHIGYEKGDLVHTVILSLKDSTTETRKEEILDLLKGLKEVSGTKRLFTSIPAETDDSRAKRDYDIILQMAFDSVKKLERYSTDSFHLNVRDQLKKDLSGPPIVYDYWVE